MIYSSLPSISRSFCKRDLNYSSDEGAKPIKLKEK
jgi:hypothetical protein